MNSTEFTKHIQYLQNHLPIDRYILGNDNVWPLIRYSLGAMTVDGLPASQAEMIKPSAINKIKRLTQKANTLLTDLRLSVMGQIKDAQHNDVIRPAKYLLVTQSIRRTELNGIWYDIFFDSLLDQNQSITDYLSLELLVSNSLRVPRYRKSVYINKALMWHALRAPRANIAAMPWLDDVVKQTANCLALQPDKVKRAILTSVKTFSQFKCYWQKMLDVIRPEVIYLVNWYSLTHLALCSVASARGICVIDIQHGLQGDNHWMYGRWRLPVSGRFELLPKVFQVWSETEQKSINAWSTNQYHRAEIVGNRWLNNNDDFFYQHGINRQFIDFISAQQKVVLYTHQWSDARYFSSKIVAKLVKESQQGLLLIRIHPGRINDIPLVVKYLKDAGADNFEIVQASVLPLPLLLSHVDLHMTYNSSTVIEAAQKGVKSVVFDPLAERYFAEQLVSGMLTIDNCGSN